MQNGSPESRIVPGSLLLGVLIACVAPAAVEDEKPQSVAAVVEVVEVDGAATDAGPAADAPAGSGEADAEEVFPTDEQVFSWFSAVLRQDFTAAREWLDQGMEVDAPLPPNPPREFLDLITESRMIYYATREQDVTALMIAAGLGTTPAVDFLLAQGADKFKKTKRNRTHPLWLAAQTGDVELMRKLMTLDPEGEWKSFTVKVSLAGQMMRLFKNGEQILESPVSSGNKSKPTPTGNFVVTDKHREWKSSLYHVSMPHFVRLSCSPVGFHAGRLPGYPASRGCIRLPADKAREFFNTIPVGALVVIEE